MTTQSVRDFLLLLAAVAAGVVILLLSPGWGLDVHGQRLLASFAIIVVVWGTGCMSLPVSCLFLLVLMAFSVTDFSGSGGLSMSAALKMSLQGFAGLVPITIVAGTAFAAVVRSSGLAERIVFFIMKLVAGRSGAATPSRILAAFFIADLPASIMLPTAVGRCAIYLAIVEGFKKPFQFGRLDEDGPTNPFQKAVWIAVALVTLIMGGAFLTGAALTIMVAGMIEQGTGVAHYWTTSFALLYLPALVMMVVAYIALLRLFPSTVKSVDASFIDGELRKLGKFGYKEMYCLGAFILMIGLFMTDAIHKIPPPMVLVLTALLLFIPGIGPGDWKKDGKHIGWDGFFIIGVALGFSNMLTEYRVMDFIAAKISLLAIDTYLTALLVMIGVTLVIRLGIASNTASAALLVPIALSVGKAAGLDTFQIVSLGWITYIFCRLSFFLPHQSVEMLMSFGSGGYAKGDLTRAALVITSTALGVYLIWAAFFMPSILEAVT